jgi:hypothetical protein
LIHISKSTNISCESPETLVFSHFFCISWWFRTSKRNFHTSKTRFCTSQYAFFHKKQRFLTSQNQSFRE